MMGLAKRIFTGVLALTGAAGAVAQNSTSTSDPVTGGSSSAVAVVGSSDNSVTINHSNTNQPAPKVVETEYHLGPCDGEKYQALWQLVSGTTRPDALGLVAATANSFTIANFWSQGADTRKANAQALTREIQGVRDNSNSVSGSSAASTTYVVAPVANQTRFTCSSADERAQAVSTEPAAIELLEYSAPHCEQGLFTTTCVRTQIVKRPEIITEGQGTTAQLKTLTRTYAETLQCITSMGLFSNTSKCAVISRVQVSDSREPAIQ